MFLLYLTIMYIATNSHQYSSTTLYKCNKIVLLCLGVAVFVLVFPLAVAFVRVRFVLFLVLFVC